MNKKPKVVAKTAAKKRGRPAGSKNKRKTLDDVAVGESVSFKEFNRLLSNTKPKVDWEQLCKRLQAALAAEIKENDCLRDEMRRKRNFFERLVCLTTGNV